MEDIEQYNFEVLMDHIKIHFPYGYIDDSRREGKSEEYLLDWLFQVSKDRELSCKILEALIDLKLVWLDKITIPMSYHASGWTTVISTYCWKTPIDYDRFCDLNDPVKKMSQTITETWSINSTIKGILSDLFKAHNRSKESQ